MIKPDNRLPRAYEVMDAVIDRKETKEMAWRLGRSPQGFRNWCREPETSKEYKSTGRFGPLDHLRTIIAFVREINNGSAEKAYAIGHYIARLLGGVFVAMPPVCSSSDSEIMMYLGSVLKETGQAIDRARRAWFEESPGEICQHEATEIRKEIDEAIVSLVTFRDFIDREVEKNGS